MLGFRVQIPEKWVPIVLFSLHVPKGLPFICHLQPLFAEPINFDNFGTCNLLPLMFWQKYPHEDIEDIVKRPEFCPFKFLFEPVPIKRVCMQIPSSIACVLGPLGWCESDGVVIKTLGFKCFIRKDFRQ